VIAHARGSVAHERPPGPRTGPATWPAGAPSLEPLDPRNKAFGDFSQGGMLGFWRTVTIVAELADGGFRPAWWCR